MAVVVAVAVMVVVVVVVPVGARIMFWTALIIRFCGRCVVALILVPALGFEDTTSV